MGYLGFLTFQKIPFWNYHFLLFPPSHSPALPCFPSPLSSHILLPPPSSLLSCLVCFISLCWGWNPQSYAHRQASFAESQYPMPWILHVGSMPSVNCCFSFPVPVPFTALPVPVHSLEPQYNAEKKTELRSPCLCLWTAWGSF